jgi:bacillolysin
MKSKVIFVFLFFFVACFLESAYVGKVYFQPRPGDEPHKMFRVPASFLESYSDRARGIGKVALSSTLAERNDRDAETQLAQFQAYFQYEKQNGNLKIRLVQNDPEGKMQHYRYRQYYKGLEVFGGEVIEHFKEGQLTSINGEYYEIRELDTTPQITKEIAVYFLERDLGKFGLIEDAEKTRLVIYPVTDGDYHVAYLIILNGGPSYSMTGILDADNGEVLKKYSNICTEDLTIGVGYGQHGEKDKFPTTFQNGIYWLDDLKQARPINQYTFDFRTYDGHYYYVASDSDNNWDYDGALVSAHTFIGLTYDYYFAIHGRKGIDDNNMDVLATIHWPEGTDNAFWNGERKHMYFLDPGKDGNQFAGALDIIAHEYSHGVTSYTSGLVYLFEPGALNESFSDIMGSAVESYWQEAGNGLLKADWYIGEDARSYFSTVGCRNLADPNSNSQLKNAGYPPSLWYPDPCHLSQEIPLIYLYGSLIDYGGVHLNMTIYSHAFYLLAHGGTNRVSKKSVSGIGIDKAIKVFYKAWSYYMVPSSNFLYAANVLLQSAYDIYGSSSNEYAQTIKAMEAIGWTVI